MSTPPDTGNTLVVIPSRLASTRLPNKPLADIHGQPMIVHVLHRAIEANLGPVLVAAGDAPIAAAVRAAGGEAILTDPAHPSGSDRIMEAVQTRDPGRDIHYVINVQGDLPTIDPAAIRACLSPFSDPTVDITTLAVRIAVDEERTNPNVVKAVVAFPPTAASGSIARALYFSRQTVPFGPGDHYHHIGLYGYRRAALERFVGLPVGVLEAREKLEQLRALEAGMRIDVVLVDDIPLGVDTPADLERARDLLSGRKGGA